MRLTNSFLVASVLSLSIFGYPLVAGLSSALGLSNTPLSIFMRATILAFSILLLLRIRISATSHGKSPVVFFFFAFWAHYMYRIAIYTVVGEGQASFPLSHYLMWGLGTCFLPAAAILLVKRIPDGTQLYWVLLVFCGASALLSAPQAVSTTLVNDVVVNLGRIQLESLNPIGVGFLGAAAVIMAFWLFLDRRILDPGVTRTVLALSLISIGSYLLLLSGSRGPLVSLFISLVFLFFAMGFRIATRILLIVCLTALLVVTASAQFNLDLFSRVIDRLQGLVTGEDLSSQIRMYSYSGAWGVFLDHPLFGGSMEDPNTMFYPHNVFLETLMATGIVGFTLFLGLSLSGVYFAYKLASTGSQFAWAGALYVLFLVQAQFSGSLYQSHGMWVCFALVSAAYRKELREPRAPFGRYGSQGCTNRLLIEPSLSPDRPIMRSL